MLSGVVRILRRSDGLFSIEKVVLFLQKALRLETGCTPSIVRVVATVVKHRCCYPITDRPAGQPWPTQQYKIL